MGRLADATTPAPTVSVPLPRFARLRAFLSAEAFSVSAAALYAVVALAALPQELVQDSWLTLVSGREVATNGLPRVDTLTVWTLGTPWIDQQWLAQLAFYGTYVLGGIKLTMLVHVAALATAVAVGVAAARALGASAKSVALTTVAVAFLAPWTLQMRAQSLAVPFFVLLLWLLSADSRSPGRRVFLFVPILVLWANLHGTVVMGAGLVALLGLTQAAAAAHARRSPQTWLPRSAVLTFAPFACLFVSPYGLDLVGYYRSLLFNPMLHWFIDEWGASTPSQKTALFYLVGAATIWLVARHGGRLTVFERAALAVTLVGAVVAIRSIVWFALAALVLVPQLVDGVVTTRPRRASRAGLVGAASLAAVLVFAVVAATRPASWYTREWPAGASERVAVLAEARPSARILSDDRYADWLLWEQPQLAGRIAYDVRFELFDATEFERLFRYRNQVGDDWRRAAAGYEILALDHRQQPWLVKSALTTDGYRTAYRDGKITILVR